MVRTDSPSDVTGTVSGLFVTNPLRYYKLYKEAFVKKLDEIPDANHEYFINSNEVVLGVQIFAQHMGDDARMVVKSTAGEARVPLKKSDTGVYVPIVPIVGHLLPALARLSVDPDVGDGGLLTSMYLKGITITDMAIEHVNRFARLQLEGEDFVATYQDGALTLETWTAGR